MGHPPGITSLRISFIRPFTLPNFVENFDALKPEFGFLSSSNSYSQYYRDLESSGSSDNKPTPYEIPDIGFLTPLKKKHSMNSYWKSIRLKLKSQKEKGEASNDLFLLLPLKIDILSSEIRIKNVGFLDDIELPASVYAYLFPFGSCCINMDIDIPELYCSVIWTENDVENSFDILKNLIDNLKSSRLSDELGSFEQYSLSVSRAINRSLFGDGMDVKSFSTHTFIFMENTSDLLFPGVKEHMWGITAAMTDTNVANTSTMTTEQINKIIPCKLKNLRPAEILYFRPASTFIYPSPIWVSQLRQEKGEKVLRRKLNCMCNNYRSFFNMLFAANRFLNDSFLKNKTKLPKNRYTEIVNCFTTAFPEMQLDNSQKIYFKHAFTQIADQIGFTSSLKSLREI